MHIVHTRGVRSRKKLTQSDPKKIKKNPNPNFVRQSDQNPNLIESMLSRVHDVIQLSGNDTHYYSFHGNISNQGFDSHWATNKLKKSIDKQKKHNLKLKMRVPLFCSAL